MKSRRDQAVPQLFRCPRQELNGKVEIADCIADCYTKVVLGYKVVKTWCGKTILRMGLLGNM